MYKAKKPEDYLPQKISKFSPYTVIHDDNIKIKLDANESFCNIPAKIKNEIKKELSSFEFNRYPDPFADKVVEKYAEFIGCDKKYITAGNGSDEIINIIVNSFVSKGEKILTFSPDFVMYSFYGEIIEANVEIMAKGYEEDFHLDFDKIKAFVSENNVKLVLFSNPCNPTGQLENRAQIEDFISTTDAVVVLDEVYMPFCQTSKTETFLYDIDKYPNLIVLKSLSKSIGLAAIRLGFAVTNETFSDVIKKMKSPYNVNGITQKIGEIVLSYPELLMKKQKEIISAKNSLEKNLNSILNKNKYKVYKTHTNFIFIKTLEAEEIYDFMLENGILIRNMKNQYLRITTGSTSENKIFLEFMQKYLNLPNKEGEQS